MPGVHRVTLDNGLRVVMKPDRSSPVVGVTMNYAVGSRDEVAGYSGFAHLFEHLMLQGPLGHIRLVQASGGICNASTRLDYTEYYNLIPSAALERILFLEAARLSAPDITDVLLERQIAVVKEEIRLKTIDDPFGRCLVSTAPEVLFDTFANAHDGLGSFADLDRATVGLAAQFFEAHYSPDNAVLGLAGDFDPARAEVLIDRHFGDLVMGRMSSRPALREPGIADDRHVVRRLPVPSAAVACVWRVPDPSALEQYLPFVVLANILTGGVNSRLTSRLVHHVGVASSCRAYVGLNGDPFDVRDPTRFVVDARLLPGRDVHRAIAEIDRELGRLAEGGPGVEELRRHQTLLAVAISRELDSALGRSMALAVLESQRGRAELVDELHLLIGDVRPEHVRAAAATMVTTSRGIVEIAPRERA